MAKIRMCVHRVQCYTTFSHLCWCSPRLQSTAAKLLNKQSKPILLKFKQAFVPLNVTLKYLLTQEEFCDKVAPVPGSPS